MWKSDVPPEQQYLSMAYHKYIKLQKQQRKVKALREDAESLGGGRATEKVGGTVTHGKIENAVLNILQEEEKQNQMETELQVTKQKLGRIIDRISDDDYRTLLEYRYLLFWEWNSVAKAMGYSRSRIFDKHTEALCAFSKVMKEPEIKEMKKSDSIGLHRTLQYSHKS